MSDFDLPDLPSDEELGITEEDRQKYADEIPEDGPELSAEEMAALLGGSSAKPDPSTSGASGAAEASEKRSEKKARKEAKRREKEARKREKEAEKEERAKKKAAKAAASGTESASGDPVAAGRDPGGSGGAGGDGTATGDRGTGAAAPRRGGPDELAAIPGWRGPATLLLLMALSLFASTRTGQVSPQPSDADPSAFSSARAMGFLEDMVRDAHPPGSPEHQRVRELLLDRLRQLGLEPEVQTATSILEFRGPQTGGDPVAQVATVRNIVARIPGSNPTGAVLVTAHYDSRGIAPGAGDDGSGVASILEALRALNTGPALRNDIIVLLTDAEELGLLGARAFVDQHPWMPEVDLVLSFEMRGGGGPSIMFETNDRNGWVVRGFQSFAPDPFANSMSYEVYERMPRDTDFTPFKEAGVQGLNFAAIDNAHVYHQVYDSPANLSESTLQHHGVHALEGLRYFANADLTSVNDANVVFFSAPVLGLVVYDQMWVLAISLLALGLFALFLASSRGKGARPSRMALAGVVSAALVAATYFIGNAAFAWLTPFHAEYGALQGSAFHSEGWYVLGLVFTSLMLLVGVSALARRWIAPLEMTVGVTVIPLILAVAAGFVAPLAAMNLQWPLIAALLSGTLMAVLGSRATGTVGWVVYLILCAPVFILLQPVVELLWLALSLEVAGILTALVTVGLFLVMPVLHSLTAPNGWWAPATFALLAGACFGVGILAAGPSAEHPAPSTLVYAYEHGSSSALWATAPEGEASPEAWAWASERANGTPEATSTLERFGLPDMEFATRPARVLLAEPPSVEVVTDTLLGDTRRAVVHLRSRIGAESIGVELRGDTRVVSINGQPVSNVEELRWIAHWGVPDPALALELTAPTGAPLELSVVEQLLRPEELLGRDAFRRPPELAPDINRLSDRAFFRFDFAGATEGATAQPDTAEGQGLPVDTLGGSGSG